MPIYAYRCAGCGHTKDVLQKVSDPPLTECPACGAATFAKQITAAGFQLKGSGWYVTDFRNNGAGASKSSGNGKDGKEGEAAKKESATEAAGSTAAAGSTSEAGGGGGGCGGPCACH